MSADPLRLTLYSRPGCHLCDEMLARLERAFGASVAVTVVDVDGDPALAARYGARIPVLLHGGEVLCEARLDADSVRRALTGN